MGQFWTLMGGGSATSAYTLFAKGNEAALKAYWPRIGTRVELSTLAKSVGRLQAGTAEIGYTTIVVESHYLGNAPPLYTTPNPDVRLAMMTPSGNAVPIAVKGDSDITDISQFIGKRIFVGQPGSSVSLEFDDVLQQGWGFGYKEIEAAGGLIFMGNYDDAIEMLIEGDLDVAVLGTNHPMAELIRLDNTPGGFRFLDLNEKAMNYLLGLGGRARCIIPKGTYKSIDYDYTGSWTSLFYAITRVGMADDAIYNFLVATLEGDGDRFLRTMGPTMKTLEFINVLPGGSIAVPWHPGAKEFWWEIWGKRGLL